jgi:hypothetical protein
LSKPLCPKPVNGRWAQPLPEGKRLKAAQFDRGDVRTERSDNPVPIWRRRGLPIIGSALMSKEAQFCVTGTEYPMGRTFAGGGPEIIGWTVIENLELTSAEFTPTFAVTNHMLANCRTSISPGALGRLITSDLVKDSPELRILFDKGLAGSPSTDSFER